MKNIENDPLYIDCYTKQLAAVSKEHPEWDEEKKKFVATCRAKRTYKFFK